MTDWKIVGSIAGLSLLLIAPAPAWSQTAPPPTNAARSRAQASLRHRVQITPDCLITDEAVYIYVAFEMTLRSAESAPPTPTARTKRAYREGRGLFLWNLQCSRTTNDCMGFQVDLTPSDYNEPIKFLDTAMMVGATLRAHNQSRAVVAWGAYLLTVDLAQDVLSLQFDTGTLAGRGTARCAGKSWISL